MVSLSGQPAQTASPFGGASAGLMVELNSLSRRPPLCTFGCFPMPCSSETVYGWWLDSIHRPLGTEAWTWPLRHVTPFYLCKRSPWQRIPHGPSFSGAWQVPPNSQRGLLSRGSKLPPRMQGNSSPRTNSGLYDDCAPAFTIPPEDEDRVFIMIHPQDF